MKVDLTLVIRVSLCLYFFNKCRPLVCNLTTEFGEEGECLVGVHLLVQIAVV